MVKRMTIMTMMIMTKLIKFFNRIYNCPGFGLGQKIPFVGKKLKKINLLQIKDL